MRTNGSTAALLIALAALVAGCASHPAWQRQSVGPEKLIVHPDGRMEFRNRLMADNDVIIYEDGRGGERAAVRVRMEPIHPDYFRDTIVVERRYFSLPHVYPGAPVIALEEDR